MAGRHRIWVTGAVALLLLLFMLVYWLASGLSNPGRIDPKEPQPALAEPHAIGRSTVAASARRPLLGIGPRLIVKDEAGVPVEGVTVSLSPSHGSGSGSLPPIPQASSPVSDLGKTTRDGILRIEKWPGRDQVIVARKATFSPLVFAPPPPSTRVKTVVLEKAYQVQFRAVHSGDPARGAFRVTLSSSVPPAWHATDARGNFATLRTRASGGLVFRGSGESRIVLEGVPRGKYFLSVQALDGRSLPTRSYAQVSAGISVPSRVVDVEFVEAVAAVIQVPEKDVIASNLKYSAGHGILDDVPIANIQHRLELSYPGSIVVVARPRFLAIGRALEMNGTIDICWRATGWTSHEFRFRSVSAVRPLRLRKPAVSSAQGFKPATVSIGSVQDQLGHRLDPGKLRLFIETDRDIGSKTAGGPRCRKYISRLGETVELPPGNYRLRGLTFPLNLAFSPASIELAGGESKVVDVQLRAVAWQCDWDPRLPNGDAPIRGVLQIQNVEGTQREYLNMNQGSRLSLTIGVDPISFVFSTLGYRSHQQTISRTAEEKVLRVPLHKSR